jgi:hypothetical protein
MKKTNKENPLTFFRKANEARQKVVKNSLTKARTGVVVPAVADAILKRNYYINEDNTLNTNNRSNVDTVNLSDPNKYVMNKTNIFGKTKFKEISKNKFDRVSNRYSNQKGSKSLGTNESVAQQVISGRNKKNYVSRVDEVRQAKIKYPDYKTEEQELILPPERQLKKGGSVKSKKK